MTLDLNRRKFLNQSFLAGAGFWLAADPAMARACRANEKLNLGIVGVAGRGGDNLQEVAGQNIVALCDIDDNNLAGAAKQFPDAKTYSDFRRMLEQKDIDAVVVSTPDHTHAVIASHALHADKHVYCEKPLAHSVWEVRHLTELARKQKRVTQMGTQIHAGSNYRRVVEVIRSGAIGEIDEVHVWADRVWSGSGRPPETPAVPANIHWDLWLGPAPERPYNPAYLPATWRGFWQFGNGTLGDMACHHMDLPFWALELGSPTAVSAEGPEVDPETTPAWLIVHYEFAAAAGRPPLTLHWYNGGKRPAYFAQNLLPSWGDGTLFVGSKGMLLADYGRYVLLPENDFRGCTPPPPTIPDSIGHHAEWIAACLSGGPTTCNFDYSGGLSEAVLLGCVAYRVGQKIEWDPKHLKALHCKAADALLKPHFRRDWKLA